MPRVLVALVLLAAGCLSFTGSGPALTVPLDHPPPRHSDGGAP